MERSRAQYSLVPPGPRPGAYPRGSAASPAGPPDAGDDVLPDWELDVDDQPGAAAQARPPARMVGEGCVAALDSRSVGFVLMAERAVQGWMRDNPGFSPEDGAASLAAIVAHWLSPAGGFGHQVPPPEAIELMSRATVRRVQSAAEVVPEMPAPHRGPAYLVLLAEPPVPGVKVALHADCIALLNERNAGWVMMKETMVREYMQECRETNRDMSAFLAALSLGPVLCHGAPVTFSDQEELNAAFRRAHTEWHRSARAVMPGLPLSWVGPVCVVRFRDP